MSEYKLPDSLTPEEKLEFARELYNRDKKIDELTQEVYELKLKLKREENELLAQSPKNS